MGQNVPQRFFDDPTTARLSEHPAAFDDCMRGAVARIGDATLELAISLRTHSRPTTANATLPFSRD
jgi:hypothetical protein